MLTSREHTKITTTDGEPVIKKSLEPTEKDLLHLKAERRNRSKMVGGVYL